MILFATYVANISKRFLSRRLSTASGKLKCSMSSSWKSNVATLVSTGAADVLLSGQTLYSQGDKIDHAYFVLQGQISLDAKGVDRTIHFGIRQDFELVAEFAFVTKAATKGDGPVTATFTATALGDTVVMPYSLEQFRQHFFTDDRYTKNLLAFLAMQCDEFFTGDAWLTGPKLVAKHLLGYFERFQLESDEPKFTQEQLSDPQTSTLALIMNFGKRDRHLQRLHNTKVKLSMRELKNLIPGSARTIERAVETLVQNGCLEADENKRYMVNLPALQSYVKAAREEFNDDSD
ncbi:MAG: cyclic nucleotide-binding domain-containing protein [Armatimonadetes bacterium]|nr:cyclic nucleotide-binding domain-containing protein [Armatimonadota bacterium]